MGKKVKIIIDPELAALKGASVPNIVEIQTKEGKTYSTRVDYVLGHPKNPMSFEACIEKFRKSINFGTKLPPKENIELRSKISETK